jgi:hypothetical protein
MLFSLTNISGLAGLIIIFISAWIMKGSMEWMSAIVVLLVILIIRNLSGEVTKKQEYFLSILVFIVALSTLFLLIY